MGRDISERKRVEHELKVSSDRMQVILETSELGSYEFAQGFRLVWMDAKALEIFGLKQNDRHFQVWAERLHPDDRARLSNLAEALDRGSLASAITEYRYCHPTGKTIWIRHAARVMAREATGRMTSLVGAVQDITEHKQAEEARIASEMQLKYMLAAADCLIWQSKVIQRKTGELDWKYYIPPSGLYRRLFGIDPGEPPALFWREIGVFELDEMHTRCFHALTSGVTGYTQEFHARVGGQIIWLREQVSVVARENESTWSLVGVITDITERKQMETALTESRNFLDKIINSVADPVLVKDRQHRWVLLNEAYCDFMGHKRDELIDKSDYDFFPKNEADVFWAKDEVVFTTGTENINEEKFTDAKGVVHAIITKKTLYTDERGGEFIVGIISDITERKLAGEKLRLRESFLSAITENQPGLLWLKDTEGRFLMVNKAFATACGRGDPEHVHGLTDLDIWPKELADKYRHDDQRVLSTGNASMVEEMIFIGNSHVWYETFKTPVRDDTGRVIGTTGFARDITGRKLAAAAVEESRQMLRSVLDTIPVRVFWKNLEGRYLGCNRSFARDAGFDSPEALIGKDDYAMGWKAQADLYRDDDRKIITSGVPKLYYEESQTTPAGKQMWLRTSKIPLRDLEGRTIGILGTYEDITERKRAEEALRESEERFGRVFEEGPTGMAILDESLRFIQVNPAFTSMLGYSEKEMQTFTFPDVTHPDHAQQDVEQVRRLLRGELSVYQTEKRYVAKSGKELWGLAQVSVVRNAAGEFRYFLANISDITERKQAAQRIADALNFNQTVLRASPVGIVVFKATGPCISANETIEQITGGSCEAVLKQNFRQLESWKKSGMLATAEAALAAQAERNLETEITTTFGRKAWFSCRFVPFNYQGEPHLLLIIGDITGRKQAEEKLREQAALLDAANDAIYVRNLDNTVTYWNDGAERLYGWTRAEALGRKITELGKVDHCGVRAGARNASGTGSLVRRIEGRPTRSGKEFVVFCRWTMLRDEQGQPKEILAINTDITERKQLEANFLRAQRMEGIGALAGGIAHDLNNILQPILMTAPLLRETTGDPESRADAGHRGKLRPARRGHHQATAHLCPRRSPARASRCRCATSWPTWTRSSAKPSPGIIQLSRRRAQGPLAGARRRHADPSGAHEPLRQCPRRHARTAAPSPWRQKT